MGVIPKDGEYFKADDPRIAMLVYGQCIRTGTEQVTARCYSELCPDGESGSYPVANIFEVISAQEFEEARNDGWPR